MNKNTEKAINNIIMKIDELINDLENDENLSTEDKLEQAQVYHNIFNFTKREEYEHNLAVLNNDLLKRRFKLRERDDL